MADKPNPDYLATFVHPTKYRHYITVYPKQNMTAVKKDIEMMYDCRFMSLDAALFDGDIKNIYTENYAEQTGNRMWIPEQDELTFNTMESTLKLRFMHGDVRSRARKFYEDYRGVKLEYTDTFRNRFLSLIMTKEPKIEYEKIREESSYMVVSYTFTNFLGKIFTESQI